MRLVHVTLPCRDLRRSLPFYQGLGLAPLVIEEDADGSPRHARLTFPDGDGTLALDRVEAPPPPRAHPAPVLTFACADLERRVAERRAAGYVFDEGPVTRPSLWREATLADPDGNRLCLLEADSYRLDPPWRLAGSTAAGRRAGAAPPSTDADFADSAWLAAEQNRGYLEAPIPSGRDEQIARLIDGLVGATAAARDAAADRLGPRHTRTLLAFAERAATLGVRRRDEAPLLQGLIAVGLSWRRCPDVRAAIPIIGLLHDAATRAGADPAALFTRAAALLPADVAPVLHDFLTRDDLDEIAESMGYALRTERAAPRYTRLWGSGQLPED